MSSTLISVSGLLILTDHTGLLYCELSAAVNSANATAQALVGDLASVFAADPSQENEWFPYARGIYQSPSGGVCATGAPLGASYGAPGMGGGSFGTGQGSLNRLGVFSGATYSWLEGMRKEIARYGPLVAASIADLPSFAAWQNGQTSFSCLFSPNFATLYWYAYNMGRQLPAQSVFAPAGIALASFALTGPNTGTLTPGAWPSQNGYTAPAPGADAYGNAVYLGGLPTAQGFAPMKQTVAVVSAAINGTCAVSVTALNQSGANEVWTAALDNLAAGASVVLAPATACDRMNGTPTAVTIAGTATAGAFSIQSGAPERAGT